jgi:cyclopropane-fatty-acyl-phospholipid synthase
LADLVHGRRIFLCSHTLEHIYEPRLFLSQIAAVLEAEDDLFLQFPSFELLVRDCRFDQIHHQHLNYFSFVSLKKLLGEFGLTITAHRYDDDHYGALMCQVRKGGDVSVPTIQRVNIDVVRASHQAFISSINAAEARIALLGGQFYCFGASLMLPILAYYLPSLAKAHAIIDMSLIKQGLTYVNFELPIIGEAEVDYLSTDFVVTAVATKAATRQIVKSLLERESRNIICPLNTL